MDEILPELILPHKGRALLVDTVHSVVDKTILASSNKLVSWTWAEILEGGAQSAGILLRMTGGNEKGNLNYVAAYDDVIINKYFSTGEIFWNVKHLRSIMSMNQYFCEAFIDNVSVLSAEITLSTVKYS